MKCSARGPKLTILDSEAIGIGLLTFLKKIIKGPCGSHIVSLTVMQFDLVDHMG